MGTHGEGPNAIKWATPAYLRRVREEHKKAYDEIKEKMGDEPFIFGRDPDECMLALIDKWNSEEEENARIAAEELEDRSDKKIVELVKERFGRTVSRSHVALILRSNGVASTGTKVADTGARRGRRNRPAEQTE